LVFYYGLPWSDSRTWGGEIPPRMGDMAVIPEGQNLIIDVSNEGPCYVVC
jgi:hypothetical protein